MQRNFLCCFGFVKENKFERYHRSQYKPNQAVYGREVSANEFMLQGIGDLPNEIIVEFLFYDIKNLGDVGDSRLKYLAEDYLRGSMLYFVIQNKWRLQNHNPNIQATRITAIFFFF